MNKEELKKLWQKWTEKQDFQLNPDTEHTDTVIQGVLENETNKGYKFCPCRLSDGTNELDLLCPCHFQAQKTWAEKGQCLCGLFVKK